MVEPVALTIFQVIRGINVEPVLTHLLPYYERDEARHVALGLRYLPALIKDMSTAERLDLFVFQMKLLTLEVITQNTIRKDLEKLGIDPRDMIDIGRGKQLQALNEVFEAIDPAKRDLANRILQRYTDVAVEWTLPGADQSDELSARFKRTFDVLVRGSGFSEEHDIDRYHGRPGTAYPWPQKASEKSEVEQRLRPKRQPVDFSDGRSDEPNLVVLAVAVLPFTIHLLWSHPRAPWVAVSLLRSSEATAGPQKTRTGNDNETDDKTLSHGIAPYSVV